MSDRSEAIDSGTDPDREREAHRLAVLEAVVDTTMDAVFSIDRDRRLTSWNRSAERIFGWTAAEIVGAPFTDLFVTGDHPTIDWFLDVVTSGDRIDRYEIDAERKGGMPTPVALSLCPVGGDDGVVTSTAAVAHDLTEQRLAQATLAETEFQVREGEALAHVGRWLWDTGTGTVQWSEEAHRIHGVEPEEFGGDLEAHVACVVEPDRERVRTALHEAVREGRPFHLDYDVQAPDGARAHVYSRAVPAFDGHDEVIGLRGIVGRVPDRTSG